MLGHKLFERGASRPRSDFGASWAGSVEVDLVGDVGVAVLLGELACGVFNFAGNPIARPHRRHSR
jgi:hypothetical protein